MAGGFSATYPINFMGMQGMGSDPYGIFGGNGLYSNPYGMGYDMSGMGYGSPYGMGMGMYNPTAYLDKMLDFQRKRDEYMHERKINELHHDSNYQKELNNVNLEAYESALNTSAAKNFIGGDIGESARRLQAAILAGNSRDICDKFDAYKSAVLKTHGEELKKYNDANSEGQLAHAVRSYYTQFTGRDLEADIKAAGNGAFEAGFNSRYNPGESDMTTEEILNHCFGQDIKAPHAEHRHKILGKITGSFASGIRGALIGGAACLGLGSLLSLMGKAIPSKKVKEACAFKMTKGNKTLMRGFRKAAPIVAIATGLLSAFAPDSKLFW